MDLVELRGFEKLWLEPGETKTVQFTITEDLLQFYDSNMKYTAEAGTFTVYMGADSRTQNKAVFTLTTV